MKFPSHLNCDGKIVSEMGPRYRDSNITEGEQLQNQISFTKPKYLIEYY